MSNRRVLAQIEDVKSGMILAEPICNQSGVLLIPESFKLNQASLNKITELGVTRLWVYDDYVKGMTEQEFDRIRQLKEKETPLKKELSQSCKKIYTHSKDDVKDILAGFSVGKSIDVNKVEDISANLLMEFNDNMDVVRALNAFSGRDDYTYNHSINVALLCSMLGKWLNLSQQEIKDLTTAGLLHDLGKAKIPIDIINKPATLTDEEFENVKQHSAFSYRAVEKLVDVNNSIKMGILMHHERLDGSGYPLKAKKDQIHQYAKIIAICDMFDALTSDRAYKKKIFPFKAFRELEQQVFGKLDPELLFLFMKNMAGYYVGEVVLLSTGEYGEIIFINPSCVYKPIVKIDTAFVDLLHEPDLSIVSFA